MARRTSAPTSLDVGRRKTAKAPRIVRISRARLLRLAEEFVGRKIKLPEVPALELSARHPYDASGLMDVYAPGRWDCSMNAVFMSAIVKGPNPGNWDGTVVYVTFNPTLPQKVKSKTYLIVANFSGYKTTVVLNGPWGENSAFTATPQDSGTALAVWSGSTHLSFEVYCTGPNNTSTIGYLYSIQIFVT